jgi:hypothetical protein
MLIKIMEDIKGWKPKWTEEQEEMVKATKDEMLKINDVGKMWRNNLKDELTKPMKPVHGRLAFLKSLGFLEGELQLTLVEFNRLYRLEKNYPPLEAEV